MPTIDIDSWNEAQDLIRAAVALRSGAKWDGHRVLTFRGRTLQCVGTPAGLTWRLDGLPTSPQALPAAFGVRADREQAALLARMEA